MGRTVGDWAIYFYFQDIVVDLEYQKKQGIGKKIRNLLIEYLHIHARDKAFVGYLHR